MFTDRLRISLTVIAGSTSYRFAAGSIEKANLHIDLISLVAEVDAYISTEQEADPLFDAFVTADLMTATLSFASTEFDGTDDESDLFTVTGYVIEKSFFEEVTDEVTDIPIVGRTYHVKFTDSATAFWRQHHPIELNTDSSMHDVVEAHKAPGMTFSYAWTKFDETEEILMVSTSKENNCSFYDFVFWYIDLYGGHFEYDSINAKYRIAEQKTKASTPGELQRDYVEQAVVRLPCPTRQSRNVLNAYTENATKTAVANEHAVTGISRDVLERSPIQIDLDRRKKVETAKLLPPEDELELIFIRVPPEIYAPGQFVKPDDEWSPKLRVYQTTYRVIGLDFIIGPPPDTVEEVPELEDESAPFEASMTWRLEKAASPTRHLPEYVTPPFRVIVEGKIISAGGADLDRTWAFVENPKTSIMRYKVDIPLWNKKIWASFEPNQVPGHWFFPLYKNERVLISINYNTSKIEAHLDWAANARTPMDGQGNRLVMGMQAVNGTIFDHIYTDEKPVLTIKRTFGKDLQTVIVKEGVIFIEVKEDDSADELQPTHDVTVVVVAAQERVGSEVRGAIGEVTGSFEQQSGSTSAALDGAIEEVGAALSAAETKLVTKLEEVDAQLQDLTAALVATTAEISDAVAQAKAALDAALA